MAIIFHWKFIGELAERLKKNTGRVEFKRKGSISAVVKIKMTVTTLHKVIPTYLEMEEQSSEF